MRGYGKSTGRSLGNCQRKIDATLAAANELNEEPHFCFQSTKGFRKPYSWIFPGSDETVLVVRYLAVSDGRLSAFPKPRAAAKFTSRKERLGDVSHVSVGSTNVFSSNYAALERP